MHMINHTYQTNFMFSREVLLLSWPLHQEDAHNIVYLLQVITVDFDTYYEISHLALEIS
jgi:hypothetical protein